MITRSFPLDLLREWGLPYGADDIVVSMETEDVGRRWMDVTTCVFRAPDDGLHYALCFDVGKTEYQEQSWDAEFEDAVQCERVERREVTETQWLPVETEPDTSHRTSGPSEAVQASEPDAATTVHFAWGELPPCGRIVPAARVVHDPDDQSVSCPECRMYLAGLRAGRRGA